MSHGATNWAIKQRGLKPAAKIVLWHLADCHNDHTGQCNPRQSTLAEFCEMGKSTLNRHLDDLEGRGLIRRRATVDPVTKRQRSTHYELALDGPFQPGKVDEKTESQNGTRPQDVAEPSPKTGHGAESQFCADPSPSFAPTRVPKWDSMNPGKEPGKEPIAAEAAAQTPDMDQDEGCASDLDEAFLMDAVTRFCEVYPRAGTVDAVRAAMAGALRNGADAETVIAGARAYADEQRGNAQRYIALPENWLERRGWERFAARRQRDVDAYEVRLKSNASLIAAGNPALCRHVTAVTCRELLHRGMVTKTQCRAAQVTW